MFLDPVLRHSHILLHLLLEGNLLFLIAKLCIFAVYILILDLDNILFILVDDTQKFPLDLYVVLSSLILVQEEHLLLQDQI
jgi:hypothetical protein